MRLLADENFPRPAIMALAQEGWDVAAVAEAASGLGDDEIFRWAVREKRLLLTFDKDFGAIANSLDATSDSGVVLFRKPFPPLSKLGEFVVRTLAGRNDWAGHFSVVEGGRVRRRSLLVNR